MTRTACTTGIRRGSRTHESDAFVDTLPEPLGLAVQDVARVPGTPVAGGTRVVLRPAPLSRHSNALPPR